jgi:hypothetical protein
MSWGIKLRVLDIFRHMSSLILPSSVHDSIYQYDNKLYCKHRVSNSVHFIHKPAFFANNFAAILINFSISTDVYYDTNYVRGIMNHTASRYKVFNSDF